MLLLCRHSPIHQLMLLELGENQLCAVLLAPVTNESLDPTGNRLFPPHISACFWISNNQNMVSIPALISSVAKLDLLIKSAQARMPLGEG